MFDSAKFLLLVKREGCIILDEGKVRSLLSSISDVIDDKSLPPS